MIDVSDTNFTSNLYAEIEHGFGTRDLHVELYDTSTQLTVYADVERKDKSGTNSDEKVTIKFATAPSNDIKVVITTTRGSTVKTPVYA